VADAILIVASIGLFIAVAFLAWKGRKRSAIAPSSEITRRIRAGEGPEAEFHPPPEEPVLPYDEIFALEVPHRFFLELWRALYEKMERKSLNSFNHAELRIFAVWTLEAEVNNGGFDQFFFNSSGELALEALGGLEMIGADAMADIVRRALAVFPSGGPTRKREKRWLQTDVLGESAKHQWSQLDKEYYRYPDDISTLVRKYCIEHRAQFGD
jgi:hypothetical protein